MKKKTIYLDYAATTPVAAEVYRAMEPYWNRSFGNPSSLHYAGRETRAAVELSRKKIADLIHALPEEIIFTSGGTESINLALTGIIEAHKRTGQHIISTTIEHPATLETLHALRKHGHEVTLVTCLSNGIVGAEKIIRAIRSTTTLITVILVQNEIGTIQPIAEIGKLLINVNRHRAAQNLPPVYFHTDACQAPMLLNLNVLKLHADLLTLDSAKMYGPKGVGILYKRRGILLAPLIHGGGQEQNLRSGTEHVPGIVGMAAALDYCARERIKQNQRLLRLRDYAMDQLEAEIPNLRITGDREKRISNNIHVTIKDIEGESLLLHLDKAGIQVSTGSACSSARGTESHVLTALKILRAYRAGSLRLTLGYQTTRGEVMLVITELKKIVRRLRRI